MDRMSAGLCQEFKEEIVEQMWRNLLSKYKQARNSEALDEKANLTDKFDRCWGSEDGSWDEWAARRNQVEEYGKRKRCK